MYVMLCVDDALGVAFNHRRQSRDRLLRARLLELSQDSLLWVDPYTAEQFEEDAPQLRTSEEPLAAAGEGEFCFLERESLPSCDAEGLYLYRWNRTYPADQWLKLPLEEWTLVEQNEFPGSSHKRITEEVYLR